MSVPLIEDALRRLRARERMLLAVAEPLLAEARSLRDAIERIERSQGDVGRRPGRGRADTTSGGRARAAAAMGAGAQPRRPRRAPRGRNRVRILAAIVDEARTAAEIARETGIPAATVSSTLTQMVRRGVADKAPRGYRAAPSAGLTWTPARQPPPDA